MFSIKNPLSGIAENSYFPYRQYILLRYKKQVITSQRPRRPERQHYDEGKIAALGAAIILLATFCTRNHKWVPSKGKLFGEYKSHRKIKPNVAYITIRIPSFFCGGDKLRSPPPHIRVILFLADYVFAAPRHSEGNGRAGAHHKKYRTDGLYIAIAAVNDLDMIISMNFQHIVKRKTIKMTGHINTMNGYRAVEIYSPMEVIENEND